jgi:hypothetical protein
MWWFLVVWFACLPEPFVAYEPFHHVPSLRLLCHLSVMEHSGKLFYINFKPYHLSNGAYLLHSLVRCPSELQHSNCNKVQLENS